MWLPLSSGIVLKLSSKNLILTYVFFRNSQDNGRAEDISIVHLWEWVSICIFVETLYAEFYLVFWSFFFFFTVFLHYNIYILQDLNQCYK